MVSEHREHVQRRLADGWCALHACEDCKREFNSPGEANMTEELSSEQTAKLVYATCCEYFGPGHEEHSILIITKAIKQSRAEVLAPVHAWYDKLFHAWKSDNRDLVTALLKSGPDLQPAAKDLEELLEKERDGTEARLLCANAECPKRHLRIEWFEEDKVCTGCLRDALNYEAGLKEGKELLREAKLEELRDWPDLCNSNSERHPAFCQYHQRIAELEKARAEGKG